MVELGRIVIDVGLHMLPGSGTLYVIARLKLRRSVESATVRSVWKRYYSTIVVMCGRNKP